jgi:hypothetical protein
MTKKYFIRTQVTREGGKTDITEGKVCLMPATITIARTNTRSLAGTCTNANSYTNANSNSKSSTCSTTTSAT